jgi:Na+/H+-dicarboxylate symporter
MSRGMSLGHVPSYVWAFLALVAGIVSGGLAPRALTPVANGTRDVLSWVVLVAPLLIVFALSPAIATLVRRGFAGRFVGAVLGWFALSTVVGSLLGLIVAAVVFRISSAPPGATPTDTTALLRDLGSGGRASVPLLAVAASVVIGLIGVKVERVYRVLRRVDAAVARVGRSMGYVMAPLVLPLGIMIGVSFGARLAMRYYGAIILYSMLMGAIWWAFYLFVLVRLVGRVRIDGRLMREYFFPTALFAAGTCSSLATIPLNLANVKRFGVRDEVADVVIPIGTIVHKGASAMQYMAYASLIAGSVFGLHVGWSQLLMAWPLVVLFTMAATGVPGAMGLGLWTGLLFASLLGLDDPLRATFVGTWVALTGGIPDMFRSAGNATADGLSAIIFSENFERYFGHGRQAVQAPTIAAPDRAPLALVRRRRVAP